MRFIQIAGIVLLVGLATVFAGVMTQSPCVCDNEWECTCANEAEVLHSITEEDLAEIPEPARSEYGNFLVAWEQEYQSRNEEWASRFSVFNAEEHSAEEKQKFESQLRVERRNFVQVFRYRHELYRQKLGID